MGQASRSKSSDPEICKALHSGSGSNSTTKPCFPKQQEPGMGASSPVLAVREAEYNYPGTGCYWGHRPTGKLVGTQFILLKLELFMTEDKVWFQDILKHPTVILFFSSPSVFGLMEGYFPSWALRGNRVTGLLLVEANIFTSPVTSKFPPPLLTLKGAGRGCLSGETEN